MRGIVLTALLLAALTAPAAADAYPVSGRFGESPAAGKDPIDCAGKRVISFSGEQRTDSKGGVPAYRNRSVTPEGPARFRVVDVFTTGQIRDAETRYTLSVIDANRIEMQLDQGGAVKLQRCK